MLKKEAKEIVWSLSNTSKMPGKSWGISPSKCKVGSKLRDVPGSTCSDCYACKGRYAFHSATRAHEQRLKAMEEDARWVSAMIRLVEDEKYFRWFDAGDLQSVDHLCKIVQVIQATPHTQHWMPTREKATLKACMREHGSLPSNLVVRLSAAMIDDKPPTSPTGTTSSVHRHEAPYGHECPASKQEGFCGDCRACWDPNVANVSYPKH